MVWLIAEINKAMNLHFTNLPGQMIFLTYMYSGIYSDDYFKETYSQARQLKGYPINRMITLQYVHFWYLLTSCLETGRARISKYQPKTVFCATDHCAKA